MTNDILWILIILTFVSFAMSLYVYLRNGTLELELKHLRERLVERTKTSEEDFYKLSEDIRSIAKASGLKWKPKEEGKWVEDDLGSS